MIDPQWPNSNKSIFKKIIKFEKKKIEEIEFFFSNRYRSKYAIFMPSARSSINIYLRYLKINRANLISINKWCSSCLFTSLGAITNVGIDDKRADIIMVNHKWGYKFCIKKKIKNKIIIENSVDSLPGDKFNLFPNKGELEVISLPKIIGSVAGGIILTNNKNFFNYAKMFQKKNIKLGINQSRKKFKKINNPLNKFDNWDSDEAWNTYAEKNTVNNAYQNLKNFDKNIKIILERRSYLKKIFKIKLDNDRLGPLVILPYKKNLYKLKKFIKHFNTRMEVFNLKYKKIFILPIHFKISNRKFYQLINVYKNS